MEDVEEKSTDLAQYAGGHPKKNRSWKDALDNECSVEVLKERYNSVLKHVKGNEIRSKSQELQVFLSRLEAHVSLVGELNEEEGKRMKEFIEKLVVRGKDIFAEAQTSKLEYWVCCFYFSSKEKIDKRDQVQHYSNQFDSWQIYGGRETWMHKRVALLEKEMRAYGGGTDAAAKPKPRDEDAVSVAGSSPHRRKRKRSGAS